ncbi:adenylyltransferase/cytidyltransferase family protein [Leptotrichia wadei]|uniref:adenylyltransferase/cytidyltransferase family protein n=1 Tax=Leptotrichia wadei TaxID=157687 RepID=UPI0025F1A597|nr:adenylyltransferase/cytidyltransferase family protein [Leptotrichia wadei]
MKKYKTGLVLGRFQTFHKGHEYIINKALEICDKVLVFIGSSDKSGTIENPFSYELREKIIKKIYKDEIVENKLVISPLADLGAGNVTKWGDYLFCEAEKILGKVDCIVYGEESKCKSWFSEKIKKSVNFIVISRDDIKINASTLREYMRKNDFESWKKFVNKKNWGEFGKMREILIKI